MYGQRNIHIPRTETTEAKSGTSLPRDGKTKVKMRKLYKNNREEVEIPV